MKNILTIIIVIGFFFFTVKLQAEGKKKKQQNKFNKTIEKPEYSLFNINKISTWIKNDGEADINPNGNSGFEFPNGSEKTAVFLSGFLYGGKVDGEIRVGGSTYNQGQVPGRILEDGTAEDRNLSHVRIYRVRRDYKSANLIYDKAIKKGIGGRDNYVAYISAIDAFGQYEKDWNEWPAAYGAPYEDINNNGTYEPSIDIPGEPGADQTIWFVANDLDTATCKSLYGSPPIGIEMQVSVFGYFAQRNVVFKKYVLINKSGKKIEDMYASMFSDPDVGDATDDYTGCDSTLNLAYAYNGRTSDEVYKPLIPPVVGYQIFQGPLVKGDLNDSGTKLGRTLKGWKNLGLTAFVFYIGGDPIYNDPNLANYEYGTLEMYNQMKGLVGSTGQEYLDLLTGEKTKLLLSGDPVNKTGWIDGMLHVYGDRRFTMSSGPFEMMPGDTQEIIIAQLAIQGMDNIDGINDIKYLAKSNYVFKNLKLPKSELNFSSVNNCLLKWNEDLKKKNQIEDYKDSIFTFQGYNIYQLPRINSSKEEYVRVKTFDKIDGIKIITEEEYNSEKSNYDLVVKQNGSDSGIERYFVVEKDYINNTTLRNGTPYYFVVGSYFVGDPEFKTFNNYETFSEPIKVIPHNPNPGIRYESEIGDSIYALHARGSAQADVNIIVVDPTEVTGDEYEIRFKRNNENKIVWDLEKITENETVLQNQTNINGSDDYIIVDGIRIIINQNESNPITEEDLYRFTTPKVIYDKELAKADVEKINVFPNPYYGYNPIETQKFGNFVMINHLPGKAVIRVFNLAGQLVRTLRKDNTEQFYLWDLQNEHQLLVASGLYILHIEMPELGKVKVLKLAVILGTEVPDFY